jgi:hypothetical protein
MANEIDLQDGVRERSNGRSPGEYWGAANSLRRNAGIPKSTNGESSPLLGNESRSDAEDNRTSNALYWEGQADFEGLTWRHRPSVSIGKYTSVLY